MGTFALTGSARGMGAATAALLRADGHRVIGVDVQDADIVADLGTPAGRRSALEGILERCGGVLDGMVPFAGIAGATGRPGDLLVSVNYFGAVELLSALQPALAAAGESAAVVISSNSTTIQPNWPMEVMQACVDGDESLARQMCGEVTSTEVYAATKAALARWVRRTAPTPEWAGAGIRLNAVAPGPVETAMVAETRADPVLGQFIDALPLPVGAAAQPETVAALVRFFLTDPAARYCCGSFLTVDGGTEALLRPDAWPTRWEV